MARNSIHIPAPPTAVWSVLCDPFAYPKWVVGTDRTLAADDRWPEPGSRFKVHVALGVKDHTTVKAVDPGRRIELEVASSYLGPAHVHVELAPSGPGTNVTMVEDPAGKLAPLRFLPPVQWAIKLRNVESLRRLRDLAVARR